MYLALPLLHQALPADLHLQLKLVRVILFIGGIASIEGRGLWDIEP